METIEQGQGQRHLQIAHVNLRSIKNRQHVLFTELVLKNGCDVLTVSESWLDTGVQDIEVEIPGYNIHRIDRLDKLGGGVCAFMRNCYKVERFERVIENLSYRSTSTLGQNIGAKLQMIYRLYYLSTT